MKPKFQTIVLKFIKEVDEENFNLECEKEINELCKQFDFSLTNLNFYQRTRCLTATLKKNKKVELVIK